MATTRKRSSSTHPKPLIRLENLKKTFGKGDAAVQVLNDVSLEVFAGEYIILYGPSGCGKSTLLNCLAGLEVPDSGKVLVRGEDLAKLSKVDLARYRNKKIGMIFQQFNVLKSFTVVDNIAIPQMLAGVPWRRRMARAHAMLKMFGLEKLAKRLPTEISGGQQQRVAIARSLVNNPWILIADEPTGNLDSKASEEVMDVLLRLNTKSHRTVILVTHNPDHLKYAHRVFYLKDGKIIKEKKQHELHPVEEAKIGEVTL